MPWDSNLEDKLLFWELLCKYSFDCKGCTECKAFNSQSFGALVPDVLSVRGDTKRVIIINEDCSGPISTGNQEKLTCQIYLPKDVTVFCTCGLWALNKINLLERLYLKGAPGHQLVPVGICENSNSVFLIHIPLGTTPSLFTLSKISLLAKFQSIGKIENLVLTGELPKLFLEKFPPIHYEPSGFDLRIHLQGHKIRVSSCIESKHDPMLRLWNKNIKRDSFVFE